MRRLLALAIVVFAAARIDAAVTDAACHSTNVTTPAQGGCFVSTTGNDNTGNGTIGSPWLTLAKCFNEAHAGDTCWFRGGTYSSPVNSCNAPTGGGAPCDVYQWGYGMGRGANAAYFVVANRIGLGGTAGNPVTIRAYTGESVTFQQTTCGAHLILADGNVQYLSFYDINFKRGSMFFSEGANHITFERNVFHNNPTRGSLSVMLLSGSNNSVRCTDWIIRNNLFISDNTDFGMNGCTSSDSGLSFTDLYSQDNAIIEHNDYVVLANTGDHNIKFLQGFKAWDQRMTFQYNYLANLDPATQPHEGLWLGNWTSGSLGQNLIRYNVLVNAGSIWSEYTNHDDFIYNNTQYNIASGENCWAQHCDDAGQLIDRNSYFNNICVKGSGGGHYIDAGTWASVTGECSNISKQSYLNNNVYFTLGGGSSNWKNLTVYTNPNPPPVTPHIETTLANWRTYIGGLGGILTGDESASTVGDPGLTNPAAGDYTLTVGSIARTGGRGGAYPTFIGADDPNSTADYVGCNFDPRCHGYAVVADTTPPSVPTFLLASPVSRSQINLAWTASTDAESGVASYNIRRCTDTVVGTACNVATVVDAGWPKSSATATYSDTGLAATTTYRYQVQAVNGAALTSAYTSGVQANPTWPIKIGPTGRYLIESNGTPWLMIGDTAHAILQNAASTEYDTWFANRQAKGVNAAWVETLCNTYIRNSTTGDGCRADDSTASNLAVVGERNLLPFNPNGDITGTKVTAYWNKLDALVRAAAARNIVLLFDISETGGHMSMFTNATNSRAYGQFLGARYKDYPNIIWISGNDFCSWSPGSADNECGTPNATDEAGVQAIALGVQDMDTTLPHLFTLQLDYFYSYSRQNTAWTTAGISTVNLSYSYHPTYDIMRTTYNLTPAVPTFYGEGWYLNNNWGLGALVTDNTVRRQAWSSLLGGGAGTIYGDENFSYFVPGWTASGILNGSSTSEIPFLQSFFTANNKQWWLLVPDFLTYDPSDNVPPRTLVTAGGGTYVSTVSGGFSNDINTDTFAPAARASDGSFAIVYIPTSRVVTIAMNQFSAPMYARWYDPSSGVYSTATSNEAGTQPYSNTANPTVRTFPARPSNSEGSADWVLAFDASPSGGAICGDGVITAPEQCDGTLLGGHTCADFGCTVGTPTCVSCSILQTGCSVCNILPPRLKNAQISGGVIR